MLLAIMLINSKIFSFISSSVGADSGIKKHSAHFKTHFYSIILLSLPGLWLYIENNYELSITNEMLKWFEIPMLSIKNSIT